MKVLLFARSRDLIGRDEVEIASPEPATVGELRRYLMVTFPAHSGLLAKSAIAVDGEFASDQLAIRSGSEVALVPPVSGG